MRVFPEVLMVVLLASLPGWALGSDTAKEQRWAEQIVDALFDDEAVWLDAGGREFLGIYTPAAVGEGRRAAILAHGIGVHPDWPQVIHPLRTRLPARGWATLSLQMPVLPNEAQAADYAPLFAEVAPRMEAGVAFLRERGFEDVVIVAHSLGAAMSTHYLAGTESPVRALVGIGMSGGSGQPRMDNVVSLKRIRLPLLDLYGSADLDQVRESAAARAAAAQAAGNDAYGQSVVQGADHFFDGREDELVDAVAGWLDRVVPAH